MDPEMTINEHKRYIGHQKRLNIMLLIGSSNRNSLEIFTKHILANIVNTLIINTELSNYKKMTEKKMKELQQHIYTHQGHVMGSFKDNLGSSTFHSST